MEFTIAYRGGTVKGSIAWKDFGLRLRLPKESFVVVDGKLSEDDAAIFKAMLARKGLALGFYDGTILPIDLIDVDTKPFAACVEYSLRVWENAQ